jgi:copper oxidase (laccase) domain-containing protein
MSPLCWDLPGGVRAAFSTAADGDQRQDDERRAWLASIGLTRPCAVTRQVHGVRIVQAANNGDLLDADGQVTNDPAFALGIFGADCPGLVIAAPDVLGTAHAGWRGTAGGIAGALAEAIAACSRHPRASWLAFIGPCIAGSRYEVDAPVLDARAWPTTALMPTRPGHACLDLAETLAADCAAAGITRIIRSGVDTSTDPRLHSYRYRGPGPTQMLAVWRD